MGSPRKHYHERKNAKQNKKNPVLSFRCPSASFKKRVKAEAGKAGVSVQEYLLMAVGQYMATPEDAPKKQKAKQGGYLEDFNKKAGADVDKMNEALDALNFKLKQ